jgi:hypothetical protein
VSGRYAILDDTGTVAGIVFGPDGGSLPTSASSQLVATDTANPGDTYADGVFIPAADGQ